jgi:hypothetical protein
MIRTLSSDIAHSWISAEIQTHVWIVPAVQSIHILALAALVFASFSASFSTIRRPSTVGSIAWLPNSYRWTWMALLVLLISGTILLTGEPTRSLMNVYFRIKVVLVVLASLLTLVLQRALTGTGRDTLPRPALVGLAAASVATWIAILFCGRFIAYFGDLAN